MRYRHTTAVVALLATAAAAQIRQQQHFGRNPYDHLGKFVRAAGDVDADGIADYMALADQNDSRATSQSGLLHVYSGKTGAVLHTLTSGASAGQYKTCGAVGDVDKDGHADIALADYARSNTHGRGDNDKHDDYLIVGGRALVISGKTGSVFRTLPFSTGTSSRVLGRQLRQVGDVDKDGTPDLALSIPSTSSNRTDRVDIFSPKTGVRIRQIISGTKGKGFGTALEGAGDLNKDGHAE